VAAITAIDSLPSVHYTWLLTGDSQGHLMTFDLSDFAFEYRKAPSSAMSAAAASPASNSGGIGKSSAVGVIPQSKLHDVPVLSLPLSAAVAPLRHWQAHESAAITCLDYLHSYKMILSGGRDGRLFLWTNSGALVGMFGQTHFPASSLISLGGGGGGMGDDGASPYLSSSSSNAICHEWDLHDPSTYFRSTPRFDNRSLSDSEEERGGSVGGESDDGSSGSGSSSGSDTNASDTDQRNSSDDQEERASRHVRSASTSAGRHGCSRRSRRARHSALALLFPAAPRHSMRVFDESPPHTPLEDEGRSRSNTPERLEEAARAAAALARNRGSTVDSLAAEGRLNPLVRARENERRRALGLPSVEQEEEEQAMLQAERSYDAAAVAARPSALVVEEEKSGGGGAFTAPSSSTSVVSPLSLRGSARGSLVLGGGGVGGPSGHHSRRASLTSLASLATSVGAAGSAVPLGLPLALPTGPQVGGGPGGPAVGTAAGVGAGTGASAAAASRTRLGGGPGGARSSLVMQFNLQQLKEEQKSQQPQQPSGGTVAGSATAPANSSASSGSNGRHRHRSARSASKRASGSHSDRDADGASGVQLPPVPSILPALLSSKEGFDYFAATVFNKPLSARHPSYNVVPRAPTAPQPTGVAVNNMAGGSGNNTSSNGGGGGGVLLSPSAALVRRLALQASLSAERIESDEERDDYFSNEGGHASQYYKDMRARLGRIRRPPRTNATTGGGGGGGGSFSARAAVPGESDVAHTGSGGGRPPEHDDYVDDDDEDDGFEDEATASAGGGGGGGGGSQSARSSRSTCSRSSAKLALSQLSVRARGVSAANIRRRLAAASAAMPPPPSYLHYKHQSQHQQLQRPQHHFSLAGAGAGAGAAGGGTASATILSARRQVRPSAGGSFSGFGSSAAYGSHAASSSAGGPPRVLRDWPMVDVPFDSRGRDDHSDAIL
jgi:hypothetical protein